MMAVVVNSASMDRYGLLPVTTAAIFLPLVL